MNNNHGQVHKKGLRMVSNPEPLEGPISKFELGEMKPPARQDKLVNNQGGFKMDQPDVRPG